MHINSVLMVLTQVGLGPEEGFTIEDESATWRDFLGDELKKLMAVKTYIYLKVRLLFDQPASSATIESINRLVNEFEWRLNIQGDKTAKETTVD